MEPSRTAESWAGVASDKAALKYVRECYEEHLQYTLRWHAAVRMDNYSGTRALPIKRTDAGFVSQSRWAISLVGIELLLKISGKCLLCYNSVSYTHLDVYKRQVML